MANYYVIAHSTGTEKPAPHSNEWPKIIAVSIETQSIMFAEGSGHGLSGCNIPIDDFDESDWANLFKATHSEWFLNYLKVTKNPLTKSTLEQEILKHQKIEIRKF